MQPAAPQLAASGAEDDDGHKPEVPPDHDGKDHPDPVEVGTQDEPEKTQVLPDDSGHTLEVPSDDAAQRHARMKWKVVRVHDGAGITMEWAVREWWDVPCRNGKACWKTRCPFQHAEAVLGSEVQVNPGYMFEQDALDFARKSAFLEASKANGGLVCFHCELDGVHSEESGWWIV